MHEWAERLGDLSGEQLKRGLDEWTGDWPPNVEQFRKACHGGGEHNTAAYRHFAPALPKPKAKPETVSRELAAMRAPRPMTEEEMEKTLRELRR